MSLSLGYKSADLNFLLVFIALAIGFIYCCIFLTLCIYHFCISTTILTNEISVLQLMISCYCGFWTLKYLFSSTFVALLYFEMNDHNEQVTINFIQRVCSGISTKLLYVIIILRVYYTFKDTLYRLRVKLCIIYFILLFIAWIIDIFIDIYVVLLDIHLFNIFYALLSLMEVILGIVFIYQFNHRLFQLILSQSSYDFHYGSPRITHRDNTHNNHTSNISSFSLMRSKPGQNGQNEQKEQNEQNEQHHQHQSDDSLLLNAKQISLLDIITKNTILASTAIISYDIFVITYIVIELHPSYDIINVMVPVYYLQITATFIEMLCVYFTFNWSKKSYGFCCDSGHKCCIKCCRLIVKRKLRTHSRHDSKSTELILSKY